VNEYYGRLPMAVATGGGRAVVSKTLNALSLLDRFDAIVTADDVKNGKPAPDIFLEAARRLNVAPELCCAFEDGEAGFVSARAAGMTVIDIRPFHKAMKQAG
jgi:HAD superfamily hydrolase (TIGR01509 family)